MAENHNPKTQQNLNHPQPPAPPPPPPPQPPTPSIEAAANGGANGSFSGHKAKYSNPPDAFNPDAATLRDQWKFAIRQYSKWYSHAWGTAILAGGAFFALGWIIKGGNPLPSKDPHLQKSGDSDSGQIHEEK